MFRLKVLPTRSPKGSTVFFKLNINLSKIHSCTIPHSLFSLCWNCISCMVSKDSTPPDLVINTSTKSTDDSLTKNIYRPLNPISGPRHWIIETLEPIRSEWNPKIQNYKLNLRTDYWVVLFRKIFTRIPEKCTEGPTQPVTRPSTSDQFWLWMSLILLQLGSLCRVVSYHVG